MTCSEPSCHAKMNHKEIRNEQKSTIFRAQRLFPVHRGRSNRSSRRISRTTTLDIWKSTFHECISKTLLLHNSSGNQAMRSFPEIAFFSREVARVAAAAVGSFA